jgi:hypothetical protein
MYFRTIRGSLNGQLLALDVNSPHSANNNYASFLPIGKFVNQEICRFFPGSGGCSDNGASVDQTDARTATVPRSLVG